jgi:hypothetical protein
MSSYSQSLRFTASATLFAAFSAFAVSAVSAAEPQPLSRAQIQQVVASHLRSNPEYAPGDLITQGDVEPIFNTLIEQGSPPADNESLYDAFLSDRDHLAKSLRTPEGRKFMRAVARLPNVFDRLERLSWSETGRQMLGELIASADGPKLLEKILTPEGMAKIEESLRKDPRGGNFQLPTGKVHTADQLIDRLEERLGKK